LNIIY